MRLPRLVQVCAAVLGVAVPAGCNGGGSLPSPRPFVSFANPSASGSAARLGAMHAVAVAFAKLPHKSALDDAKALLTFIQKDRKAFSAAGIYDGQLWAKFADGKLLVVANAGTSTKAVKPNEPAPAQRLPARRDTLRLRAGAIRSTAYVFGNSVFFPNQPIAPIAKALQNTGYDVVAGDATVDNLKAVHDARVLYLSTHGVAIRFKGEVAAYAVETATRVSANGDVRYAGDIADGSIIYGMGAYLDAVSNKEELDPVYVVSRKFFQKYVRFEKGSLDNSVVYIDACFSASPLIVGAWSSTMKSLGATAYVGWTKETGDGDADTAAEYFFDRTLPEDQTQGAIHVERPSPPQPAADLLTAYLWMKQVGLTVSDALDNQHFPPLDTGTASTLEIVNLAAPNIPQLAPLLQRLIVQDVFYPNTPSTISGVGEWGAPQDAASLAWGISKSVTGPIETQFPPPTSSAGSVKSPIPSNVSNGYVRVVEDGVKSNAAPLTEWDGTISDKETLTIGQASSFGDTGKVTYTAVLHVGLRTDVNPTRTKIDGKALPFALEFSNFMPSSTGTLSGTGSWTVNGVTVTYSANSEKATVAPEYIVPGTSPASFFVAQLTYQASFGCDTAPDSLRTACLVVDLYGPDVATCTTTAGGCPAGSNGTPVPWQSNNTTLCGPGGTTIPFTMNRKYALSAPTLSCPAFTPSSSPYGVNVPVTEEQTWTSTFGAAHSPPTKSTATGE
jgi:hypothetical protein